MGKILEITDIFQYLNNLLIAMIKLKDLKRNNELVSKNICYKLQKRTMSTKKEVIIKQRIIFQEGKLCVLSSDFV